MLEPQLSLFEPQALTPEGLLYEPDFLTPQEEQQVLAVIAGLDLQPMKYKAYEARRRVISFGGQYDFDAQQLRPAPPLPETLAPLREKVAGWLGVAAQAFTQTLVAEYQPGTPLGWHRDVPDFEDVVGVSLLGEAVMRFRPYPPQPGRRSLVVRHVIAPRSVYLLRGVARWGWQHCVMPTPSLRYSVTFRTPARRQALD